MITKSRVEKGSWYILNLRLFRLKIALGKDMTKTVIWVILGHIQYFGFVRVCGSIPAQGKLVQTNY